MTDFRGMTFSLHGLDTYNQAVDGEIFARKFGTFMRGLGKSDSFANGGRRHIFLIRDLHTSSAVATVEERMSKRGVPPQSGIGYYLDGASSIYNDTPHARTLPLTIVQDIATLPKGAGRTFSFAEIRGTPITPESAPTIIRIDEFLERRAKRVLQAAIAERTSRSATFDGTALSSFDGVLKAVDLRGVMQKAVLLLSAGGKPIECIVNTIEVTELGDALDRRVIVYGLAHYDRGSGLPTRLDVRRMEVLQEGATLSRWRGAFDIPPVNYDRDGWDRQ